MASRDGFLGSGLRLVGWFLGIRREDTMPTTSSNQTSKLQRWTSYVLSALPVLFMTMSSAMKLVHPPMIVEGFAKNGMTVTDVTVLGVIELLCVVVYLIPRTAVLGAVLVTGYLGGAIMVHVRAHETALVTPLILGMCAWGGLFMRDPRIRELLPLRRKAS